MKKIFVIFCLFNFLSIQACLADTVIYNTKTGKIHSPGCQYAKKCTVNCISIDRKDALKRGGVSCKVCGAE